MKRYTRGIFIGKFYPFHLGHLATLEKLAGECEESFLIFYYDPAAEARLAAELGESYDIHQRILDAQRATKDLPGVSVKILEIPSHIIFPRDFLTIKAMVKELIGGEPDVQIFGAEEESIYLPYKYSGAYLLGLPYSVVGEEGSNTSLRATAIRKNYPFYRQWLPEEVQESLDALKDVVIK